MPESNDSNTPHGCRVSWPVLAGYLLLLAIGIPWYWPKGVGWLWFGMPAWVVTAIGASAAVSLLTAILLCRPWPDEGEDEGEETR